MEESDSLMIDVGKYIEILLRQWQLIILPVIILVPLVIAYYLLYPKTYTAHALVASNKVYSSATFGSNIQTTSETQLMDPRAREQAYVLLVRNPVIAQTVIEKLGNNLPAQYKNPAELIEIVSGKISGNSDLIEIDVSDHDPMLATLIANEWGQAYVSYINNIYSESGVNNSYVAIQDQTSEAKNAYDLSVKNYADYKAQSARDSLEYQTDYLQIRLSGIVTETVKVDQLLLNARNMRDQVHLGGEGAALTNAIALSLLKAQVFAGYRGPENFLFQTTPANITQEAMVKDLDSLISILEDRRKVLIEEIQTLSGAALSGDPQTTINPPVNNIWNDLQADSSSKGVINIRDLQAQLVHETEREQELIRSRDLAWDAYKSLSTKAAELSVAKNTTDTEVTLASPASVPTTPTGNFFKYALVISIIGLLIGLFLAFGIEFWWKYKGQTPRSIGIKGINRKKKKVDNFTGQAN